jgi:hypothetical protein
MTQTNLDNCVCGHCSIIMISPLQALPSVLQVCCYSPQLKNDLHREMAEVLTRFPLLYCEAQTVYVQAQAANLLLLRGVVPVFYNRVQTKVPIRITYPPTYPSAAPSLHVESTAEVIINQNNSAVGPDGAVSLKTLQKWKKKHATVEIIEEAKKSFEKKLPVIGRQAVVTVQKVEAQAPVKQSGILGFISSSLNSFENSVHEYLGNRPATGEANPRFASPYTPVPAAGNPAPLRQTEKAPDAYSSFFGKPQPGPSVAPPSVNIPSPIPASSAYPQLPVVNPPPSAILKKPDPNAAKQVYLQRIKELKQEITSLTSEKATLLDRSQKIAIEVSEFKCEMEESRGKKEIIRASLMNTIEWIGMCREANVQSYEVSEEELVEYRNVAAKRVLEIMAEERAMEAVVGAVVDGMSKNVISAKDTVGVLRQIYLEMFMKARMKDKMMRISQEER